MKHLVSTVMMALLLCAMSGCKDGKASGSSGSAEETFGADASYALGMNIGSSMKADAIQPDMGEFIKGLNDSLGGAKTRFTPEQTQQIIQQAFTAMREKVDGDKRRESDQFLAENSTKPGVIITPSGLQYEVIVEGSGEKPAASDTVRVQYEGTLPDGTVFDSSYSRGEPAEFPLSGVISGWTEGIQLMNVGGKYRFYIPSDLGYGSMGAGQMIPPYAALIFEVELLDIVR